MLLRALDDDDAEPPALTAASDMSQAEREAIKRALMAVRRGDFTVRVDAMRDGIDPGLADVVNDVVELNQRMTAELRRIRRVVGSEGRIRNRASTDGFRGGWARSLTSVNDLIADLTEPTIEVDRVLGAVAKGDLGERMAREVAGRPLRGEFRRSADIVNTMVDQLNAAVARLVLSELAPLVDVQRGAFYVADDSDGRRALRLVASYAADPADDPSARIAFGEGLVGQAAAEGRRILVTEIPSHYVPIRS